LNEPSSAVAGCTVAFIGLGQMGLPMAQRLIDAGFVVHGFDIFTTAGRALVEKGGKVFPTARAAARGVDIVVTMLPNGSVVREALLGDEGVIASLDSGALVIDMSSSAPVGTQALGASLANQGIRLIDAPVSGGVSRAKAGTLTIMAGGDAADILRARSLFDAVGSSLFETGALGTGHAMKALNNYVSAAGLTAACEALVVGQSFGLQGNTIVDILNVSTGRNNATEFKLKPFILSGTFGSGFALRLLAKDIGIAADLAAQMHSHAPGMAAMSGLWSDALEHVGGNADHTEIFRFLSGRRSQAK
jgi:3-hydroxyisobutyrate dehydrogenase